VWYQKNEAIVLGGARREGYVSGTASYRLYAAAALRDVRRTGRIEKNLFRQGTHRSAGSPSMRPTAAVTPGTCSGAIRCN